MFDKHGFVTNENFIGAVDGYPIRGHNYVSNDTANAIEAAGYFNGARDLGFVRKGDIVEVSGDRDGTPFHSSYVFATVPDVGGGDVLITEHKAVTQNVVQELFLGSISSKGADAAVIRYVPTFDGTIEKIYTVLNAALATGNATFTVAINGVAVTNGVATATQAGSAAGDVDVATPTAAKTFVAGSVITVTAGGASTATATANVTLQLVPA